MRPVLAALSLAFAAMALGPGSAPASRIVPGAFGSSQRGKPREEEPASSPGAGGWRSSEANAVSLLQYAYNKQNPRPLSRPGMPEPKTQWAKPLPRAPGSLEARRQHRSASRVFSEPVLLALVALAVVPIGAQWLAWLLEVPAGGVLLIFAALAGPLTGLFNPDALLGNLLLPLVSLVVAVLIFEAGLRLRFADIGVLGRAALRMNTVAVAVTWPVATAAAYFVLRLDASLSLLLGTVVAMAAPSVEISLRQADGARHDVEPLLACEGNLIDLVGPTVIVCVLEGVLFASASYAQDIVFVLVNLLWVGGVVGLAGAALVVLSVKHRGMPESLDSAIVLMLMLAAFAGATLLQADAGFFAAGVMGLALANQRAVRFDWQLWERGLLVQLLQMVLLLLLVARLQPEGVTQAGVAGVAFVLLLAVMVRPAAATLATAGLGLDRRERSALAWAAPRGLLAVAVGTLCALGLADARMPEAERLVPLLVLLFAATVVLDAITGALTSFLLARSVRRPAVTAGRAR